METLQILFTEKPPQQHSVTINFEKICSILLQGIKKKKISWLGMDGTEDFVLTWANFAKEAG